MGKDQPRHAKVTKKFEPEVLQPELLSEFLEGKAARRAGIVHENINPSPRRGRYVHDASRRRRVREVCLDGQHPPPAETLDRCFRVREGVATPGTERHVSTLAAQPFGNGAPDATTPSRHNSCPPCQSEIHVILHERPRGSSHAG